VIDYKRKMDDALIKGTSGKALYINDFGHTAQTCSQSYPQIVCGTFLALRHSSEQASALGTRSVIVTGQERP
jgi:hypothetical protein